jgi:hypothetical protein
MTYGDDLHQFCDTWGVDDDLVAMVVGTDDIEILDEVCDIANSNYEHLAYDEALRRSMSALGMPV